MTLAEALIEYHIDQAISGACFDLLAYLTTLDPSIGIGHDQDCAPVLDRFKSWAAERGLDIEDADVLDWENTLGTYLGLDKDQGFDELPESFIDEDAFSIILSKIPRRVRDRLDPEAVSDFLSSIDRGMDMVRAAVASGLPFTWATVVLDTARSLGIL